MKEEKGGGILRETESKEGHRGTSGEQGSEKKTGTPGDSEKGKSCRCMKNQQSNPMSRVTEGNSRSTIVQTSRDPLHTAAP